MGMSIPDAEDVVSEALIRAVTFRRLDGARLDAFIVTVIRRICIDEFRRNAKERQRIGWLCINTSASSHEELACARDLVRSLLRLLSPTEQRVVCLSLDGLTHAEIARTLGLTAKASEVALSRARAKIRSCQGGPSSAPTRQDPPSGVPRTVATRPEALLSKAG
jgi:RNA polymerase sigma-70 factor (ECF subfamily)